VPAGHEGFDLRFMAIGANLHAGFKPSASAVIRMATATCGLRPKMRPDLVPCGNDRVVFIEPSGSHFFDLFRGDTPIPR
jgi:hypothetical protein